MLPFLYGTCFIFDIGMQIGGALRLKCMIEGFGTVAMLQMKFLSFELKSEWKVQAFKL